MSKYNYHADLQVLVKMVKPNSRVLDIGCGNGELLKLLTQNKNIDARGVELDQSNVNQCVAEGLSVMQGNADTDLTNYPNNIFDYVILSKTIQATNRPDLVLKEMLRIGKYAIISFHNFGHWQVRACLGFKGKIPVRKNLNYTWYKTPDIHYCTINDFINLCSSMNFNIVDKVILNKSRKKLNILSFFNLNNLLGYQGIFLLKKILINNND